MTDAALFAPYAPLRAIQTALEFHRERGLGEPIDRAALRRSGVADSMTARTLQALRFLGLLDGEYGSELFDALRRATADEVPGLLASILRRAYPKIFAAIDPSSAADHELAEAFRLFEPAAQRPKMIALFRGLCVMADIIRPDAPARPAAGKRNQTRANRRAASTRSAFELDPVIRAVVDALPPARRWSPAQRERWLEALRAAVDLTIEVTPPAGN